eukprot:TRINITY_DN721_c2_g1_i1.p1 TRINITY_DN721_c2_g1~~TRINITY_DN721_c2_g1_i1.p1  ORF type:complete len:699 (-),score=208.56 TRINITY_DN721_c2_g1_i1:150-2246(-)
MSVYAANCPANKKSNPILGEDAFFVTYHKESKSMITAVIDGHGGTRAARFATTFLANDISKRLDNISQPSTKEIGDILKESFTSCDLKFMATIPSAKKRTAGFANAGCCALVTVLRGRELVTANVGDCRAILSRKCFSNSSSSEVLSATFENSNNSQSSISRFSSTQTQGSTSNNKRSLAIPDSCPPKKRRRASLDRSRTVGKPNRRLSLTSIIPETPPSPSREMRINDNETMPPPSFVAHITPLKDISCSSLSPSSITSSSALSTSMYTSSSSVTPLSTHKLNGRIIIEETPRVSKMATPLSNDDPSNASIMSGTSLINLINDDDSTITSSNSNGHHNHDDNDDNDELDDIVGVEIESITNTSTTITALPTVKLPKITSQQHHVIDDSDSDCSTTPRVTDSSENSLISSQITHDAYGSDDCDSDHSNCDYDDTEDNDSDPIWLPIPLTNDHNCENKEEVALVYHRTSDPEAIRPAKRGQRVQRVGGSLMTTRAIGDFYLKNEDFSLPRLKSHVPYITCEPEISHMTLQDDDHWLILACDGIWECLENDEVAVIIKDASPSLMNPAKLLLNRCFDSILSTKNINMKEIRQFHVEGLARKIHDDMTCVIVNLKDWFEVGTEFIESQTMTESMILEMERKELEEEQQQQEQHERIKFKSNDRTESPSRRSKRNCIEKVPDLKTYAFTKDDLLYDSPHTVC